MPCNRAATGRLMRCARTELVAREAGKFVRKGCFDLSIDAPSRARLPAMTFLQMKKLMCMARLCATARVEHSRHSPHHISM